MPEDVVPEPSRAVKLRHALLRMWARLGPWDLGTLAIVALVVGTHLIFTWTDPRVTWDPGRFYLDLPEYFHLLGTVGGAFAAFFKALGDSTGWYELALAIWLRIVGRSPEAFELVSVAWVGLIVGMSGLLARRLGGPAAGFAAATMVSSFSSITIYGRTPWIHVPETALVLTMLWALTRDLRVERWRTAWLLGLLGAITLNMRESGLVWVGSMVPLLIWLTWPWRGQPRPWKRIGLVAGLWALAGVPLLFRLEKYIGGKLGARERYAMQEPDLSFQITNSFGEELAWVVLIGAAVYAWRLRRKWHPVGALLLGWGLIPFLLFALFRAGFTNYTPFIPALGVAAACGLVMMNRALAVLPLPFLFVIGYSWLPLTSVGKGALVGPRDDIKNYMRTWQGFNAGDISALLDASCPKSDWHACKVVAEQGVFYPATEEFGLIGLFLMAEDRVELRGIYDPPARGWGSADVHAFAYYDCGSRSDSFYRRAPGAFDQTAQLIQGKGMLPVYSTKVDSYCSFYWLTPNARLVDPSVVPRGWLTDEVTPFSSSLLYQLKTSFFQRNPDFQGRTGAASLYTDHFPMLDERPDGWDVVETERERIDAGRRVRAAGAAARAAFDAQLASNSTFGSKPEGVQGVQGSQGGGMKGPDDRYSGSRKGPEEAHNQPSGGFNSPGGGGR